MYRIFLRTIGIQKSVFLSSCMAMHLYGLLKALVLVVPVMRRASASQRSIRYHAVPGFPDKLCVPEFPSPTWNFTAPNSAMECSINCFNTPECKGVFYNSARNTCFGGSHMFSDSSYCQDDPGSVYFTMDTIPHQGTCDGTVPCSGDNMECWDGKCVCTPGYSYWPRQTACVANCRYVGSQPGTTYQIYRDWKILGLNVEVYLGDYSSDECKLLCSARSDCNGFDLDVVGTKSCALDYGTPLTHPGSFQSDADVDYYHRNCE